MNQASNIVGVFNIAHIIMWLKHIGRIDEIKHKCSNQQHQANKGCTTLENS